MCFFSCHCIFVLGFSHPSKQLLRLSHPRVTKIQVQAFLRKVNDKRNHGETCEEIQSQLFTPVLLAAVTITGLRSCNCLHGKSRSGPRFAV